MAWELYYTSTPQGLRPGSSGFCTVGAAEGMPASLMNRLESLSSYQPLYSSGSEDQARNPVLHAHWRIESDGRVRSVLSRIALSGLDHTLRPNMLAYHLVLETSEQPASGPACLISRPGIMRGAWDGPPRRLTERELVLADDSVVPASSGQSHWQMLAGDAGWAGLLVEAFVSDPRKPAWLIFEPGTDPLPLLCEASRLVPAGLRWQLTFNTCFTDMPAGLACAWRCAAAGTLAAGRARSQAATGVVVDLTRPPSPAPDRPSTRAVRNGEVFAVPAPGGAAADGGGHA